MPINMYIIELYICTPSLLNHPPTTLGLDFLYLDPLKNEQLNSEGVSWGGVLK